jgi:hypothetical protein
MKLGWLCCSLLLLIYYHLHIHLFSHVTLIYKQSGETVR